MRENDGEGEDGVDVWNGSGNTLHYIQVLNTTKCRIRNLLFHSYNNNKVNLLSLSFNIIGKQSVNRRHLATFSKL